MKNTTIAILTVSDRCSAGVAEDTSGPFLVEEIKNSGLFDVSPTIEHQVVADEKNRIKEVLLEWCDRNIGCIITTGGTGFSARDVTPEATKEVIEREAPGITLALISGSLQSTPLAMLSRLTAGICKNTLIVNFPGSRKACVECFEILRPVLKHALDQLRNDRPSVDTVHRGLQDKSKVRLSVASRDRKSPYEMLSLDSAHRKLIDEIQNYFNSFNTGNWLSVKAEDLFQYSGYTLAQDVYASVSVPPFPASIKDGYAVIAQDGAGVRHVLPRASVAGSGSLGCTLTSGYCVRISTGAAVPAGANAVVQVEDTELIEATADNEEAKIVIKSTPVVGQEIRQIGCDIQADQQRPLIRAHTVLLPIELGLIASTGVKEIKVFPKPRVAVLSTGDEVVSPGEPRPPNSIWDSNRTVLLSMLTAYKPINLGISPDNPDDVYRSVKRGLEDADCLITTGGVSMGEKDLLKHILREDFAAEIHFGRVNLKPGKPTTFATCTYKQRKKFIFALPGNPVSAFVAFRLFVQPSLDLLSGRFLTSQGQLNSFLSMHKTVQCQLQLSAPYKLDGRPEFVRAVVSFGEGNFPIATLTELNQLSSRLLNVKDANALVLLEAQGQKCLENGALVKAILL